jgi:hypothetical protein
MNWHAVPQRAGSAVLDTPQSVHRLRCGAGANAGGGAWGAKAANASLAIDRVARFTRRSVSALRAADGGRDSRLPE